MKNGVFWDVTPCDSRFLQEPHGVRTQKTPFFKVKAIGVRGRGGSHICQTVG
jgi:hypothetical protein